MKAAEIMNPLISVDKDALVIEALNLMDKHKLTHILVTEKNKVIGYCSDLNIADRLGSSRLGSFSTKSIHVSSVMASFNLFIESSTPVSIVADRMICESKTIYPVGGEDKTLGFITMHDFAKICESLTGIKINKVYSTIDVFAKPDDRLVNLRNILIENNFVNAAPVLDGSTLVGLTDIRMIARKLSVFRSTVPGKHQEESIRRVLVFDAMMQNPPTLTPNSSIAEAAKIFTSRLIYGIPVLENGILLGVLQISDLVKYVRKENKF